VKCIVHANPEGDRNYCTASSKKSLNMAALAAVGPEEERSVVVGIITEWA